MTKPNLHPNQKQLHITAIAVSHIDTELVDALKAGDER
jgi:hypothetical protein